MGTEQRVDRFWVAFDAVFGNGRWLAASTSQRRAGLIAAGVMVLVAFMGVSAVVGFLFSSADQARLRHDRILNRDTRVFLQALVNAETGVRGFVLSGRVDYLEPYIAGRPEIEGATMLARLDRAAALHGQSGQSATAILAALRQTWRAAITLGDDQKLAAAQAVLVDQHAKPMMDEMRRIIAGYLADRDALVARVDRRIRLEQDLLLVINPAGALIALLGTGFAFWRGARDARAREVAQQEMQILFQMTDMLQSVADREDANEVLRATAGRLLPGFSGALYVFSNSRDRLDLSTSWGGAEGAGLADHIGPHTCWALKRGKAHLNGPGGLLCTHPPLGETSLEMPMAARGELYGLLAISTAGPDATARLEAASGLAAALGDAMSLSLSSNALREKLRNQALRDGLTGLYNRRFLEEMLERLTQDAARREVPISAIMIDLDHFKRLNDQFGHGSGDAVLQEVARTLLAGLRNTDVACRYGGEELLVLLPDCALEAALAKAEQLRLRIQELDMVGQPVTASLGVACIPTSAANAAELLAAADGALYRAKREGRDRVAAAPPRGGPPRVSLVPGSRAAGAENPPMNHA